MKTNFYIGLQIGKKCEKTNHELVARLIREVHHYNKNELNDEKVVVSFPEMAINNKLGHQFQVFGSFEALEKLCNQYGFTYFSALRECFVRSIRPAPISTEHGYYSFHRNRSHERNTPAYVAKTEAKLIKRAMEGKNKSLKSAEDVFKRRKDMLENIAKKDNDKNVIHIRATSSTQDRGFFLYIDYKKHDEYKTNTPNNYGMSRAQDAIALPVILDPFI